MSDDTKASGRRDRMKRTGNVWDVQDYGYWMYREREMLEVERTGKRKMTKKGLTDAVSEDMLPVVRRRDIWCFGKGVLEMELAGKWMM